MATATDEELIVQVALVERGRGEDDAASLGIITKPQMLQLTTEGAGAEDAADRRLDVTMEDVDDGIASVTVRSAVDHEYLHLVRTVDGWKIADALDPLT